MSPFLRVYGCDWVINYLAVGVSTVELGSDMRVFNGSVSEQLNCSDDSEDEISSRQFLDDVRKNETFSKKKPLDKKIIHLLELPNISVIEIIILKNYLEM